MTRAASRSLRLRGSRARRARSSSRNRHRAMVRKLNQLWLLVRMISTCQSTVMPAAARRKGRGRNIISGTSNSTPRVVAVPSRSIQSGNWCAYQASGEGNGCTSK